MIQLPNINERNKILNEKLKQDTIKKKIAEKDKRDKETKERKFQKQEIKTKTTYLLSKIPEHITESIRQYKKSYRLSLGNPNDVIVQGIAKNIVHEINKQKSGYTAKIIRDSELHIHCKYGHDGDEIDSWEEYAPNLSVLIEWK